MPWELLDLLQGHPVLKEGSSDGVAQEIRIDLRIICSSKNNSS
jgi:hypothetical protein